MAEGFEAYDNVPQQSRRDKLRIDSCSSIEPVVNHHGFLPLYDPSFISSSEFLSSGQEENRDSNIVKEGVNFMGFVQNQQNPYLDPRSSSLPMNNSPFINYSPLNIQNLRDFEAIVFKPEPLSLSLSSHPLELNLQKYGSAICNSSSLNEVGSVVHSGQFTGNGLKGSSFLKPAQQLLEGSCDVGIRHGTYNTDQKLVPDPGLMDLPPSERRLTGCSRIDDHGSVCVGDGGESRRKKSKLSSMLDEGEVDFETLEYLNRNLIPLQVYRRYKQYYQQMQAIVTSFEYISGLNNAAPYANLAVKAMTKQFRCLKNTITDQLQFIDKAPGQFSQTSLHNTGFLDHQPVWRSQRGLPERAVTVLRAWLFEHFLHPYPTDTDKLMLAKQTGLSRSQVSNWFINARVRLWKPMVEEIHMLETRHVPKAVKTEERTRNTSNDHIPSSNSLASENQSTSNQHIIQENPSKRSRNELPDTHTAIEEPSNMSYNFLSHTNVGGSSSVSLTLGLHRNINFIGPSEPFAQRFGLGLNQGNGEGYLVGDYGVEQNRHFGRDVHGGQLFHDFVG